MGRGAKTRDAILSRAVALASQSGLSGLTIGGLAKDLGLSKSGLIAHFGTKEALDLAVLQAAAKLFGDTVIVPAFDAEPGEPRLRVLFDNWFRYTALKELPGGDLFFPAIAEFDDRPGICRYYVARVQRDWMLTLENATREAIQIGQFRAGLDTGQISFTILSLLNGYHVLHRLLNAANAEQRARAAFESLMSRARVPGVAAPSGAPDAARADAEIRAQQTTGKAAVAVTAPAPAAAPAPKPAPAPAKRAVARKGNGKDKPGAGPNGKGKKADGKPPVRRGRKAKASA